MGIMSMDDLSSLLGRQLISFVNVGKILTYSNIQVFPMKYQDHNSIYDPTVAVRINDLSVAAVQGQLTQGTREYACFWFTVSLQWWRKEWELYDFPSTVSWAASAGAGLIAPEPPSIITLGFTYFYQTKPFPLFISSSVYISNQSLSGGGIRGATPFHTHIRLQHPPLCVMWPLWYGP